MNAPDTVLRFLAENPLITHDLVQGTPEWHGFRAKYDGASEAAPVLGLSKKVSRTELLRAKSTGIAREFSDFVQTRILDRGHEVEALARPVIEERIGRSLYPGIYSRGTLSYSSDGLTAAGDLAFEHKQWNAELAAAVGAGILPDEHWPQCQQALLVTGAEKLLFVVSDGTAENMVSVEVLPDHEKFAQLLAGWAQFEKDLAEYQHVEDAPKPVGRAPDQLPALRIEVTGMVTDSNLDRFHGEALAVIGAINTNLETDEDFADAEKTVKWCAGVEDQLEAAKQHALSQTESIDKLFRTMDSIKEEARQTRLKLEKLVKARKDAIRVELVQAANGKYAGHVADLQAEIAGIRLPLLLTAPDFGGAIKGLKTIASLRDKLDTALANGKIEADKVAQDVRAKLAWCKENAAGHHALFPDLQQIISKPMEDFTLTITSRIEKHKAEEAAKLEAERAKIRAEEEAKARAKAEAEAKEKAEEEDALIKSIFDNSRRIEAGSVQHVEKAIAAFESGAKDFENDPRPRVVSAISEAREYMQARLSAARNEATSTKQSAAEIQVSETAHQASAEPEKSLLEIAQANSGAGTVRNPRPTRAALIETVAKGHHVSVLTADEWLRAEFGQMAA